ncbi:MAG: dephospho-CoA kinase [Dehalococcoidia bacterium]|nr:dephospho-CoA kinase [Dehalococcoidia bacterium]
MFIIGLAGGIGSGKSTVASILRDLGAVVFDTDQLIREAYGPGGELTRLVAELLGPDTVAADGSADRAKIAAMIFADEEVRRQINALIHPWVAARWRTLVQQAEAQGARVAVIEGALYADKSTGFDQLWVVVVDREIALQRATQRGGLTRQQAEARMATQLPPDQHAKLADVVVDTRGSLDEVRKRVSDLWQQHIALAVQ